MNNLKFIPTPKIIGYFIKFILRITAFIIMIWLYIRDKNAFYQYTITSPMNEFNFMHLMWLIFIGLMTLHLFPSKLLSMGAGKSCKSNFTPVQNYSEADLLTFVQNENKKAWRCMLCWLLGNAAIGLLYYCGIIGKPEILLISGFFFICDYICILIFCPFQTFGMKNRCCVNCRIYDWGHFMMFTPMLFLGTFYSLPLFFMSCAVIIHWEVKWTNHPERFWYGSNQILSCKNCRDKTCQLKRKLKRTFTK
ncbi:MAG: hypothetical protein IKJ87_07125 [Ruminococcus sp.]|nr:hypothetical protein [Ruminococcus sp.]